MVPFWKRIWLIALCHIAALPALGQHLPVVDKAFDLTWHGKYLPALATLETAYAHAAGEDRNNVGQFLGIFSSLVARQDTALTLFDDLMGPVGLPGGGHALDGLKPEDAVEAIAREAKDKQIVILNEAHHVPVCRHFAMLVARALKKEGFQFFAAETFAPDPGPSWRAHYPKLSLGNYTREPEYGNLIREVMRLGYTPVSYEATYKSGATWQDREQGEVANLLKNVLRQHPAARVFIYCGYAHEWQNFYIQRHEVDGHEEGERVGYMAAYLKQETGADLLCIDQTLEMAHSRRDCETPEYRSVADDLSAPSVFRLESGEYEVFGEYRGQADLQVFHPRYRQVFGRPSWMLDEDRKPLDVPAELKPQHGRALFQAFYATDPPDAVPLDQVVLEAGKPLLPVLVPAGRLRFVLQDENGNVKPITLKSVPGGVVR